MRPKTDDKTPVRLPVRPGSFRDVLMASDEDHDAATALALVALGAATGCSPAAGQRLRDSPIGAGLGAMVVSLCDEENTALGAAVDEAARRQQGWVFSHAAAREHRVAHDLPYLTGRAEVMACEAQPAPDEDLWWLPAPRLLPPEMLGPVDWPEGLREAVGDVAGLAFRLGLDGLAGAVEEDIVLLAVAMISRVCDVTLEGAVAFLADDGDGLAFAQAVRSEQALEPGAGLEMAHCAALATWRAVPLGRMKAKRTGFSPGLPCLQGIAMAHDWRLWMARQDRDQFWPVGRGSPPPAFHRSGTVPCLLIGPRGQDQEKSTRGLLQELRDLTTWLSEPELALLLSIIGPCRNCSGYLVFVGIWTKRGLCGTGLPV
jgi:hypothetical protein